MKRNGFSIEAVIVIGGCHKGTRFRPLSLELPKPLFPVAGRPIIEHLLRQCATLPKIVNSVSIIGYYPLDDRLSEFIQTVQRLYSIPVRYLQEHCPMGTGGGMMFYRDRLLASKPDAILFINGDVYADLPLNDFVEFYMHKAQRNCCILVKDVREEESIDYGCVVVDENDSKVKHYVEKPTDFVSPTVNCGVYLLNPEITFKSLNTILEQHENRDNSKVQLEQELFPALVNENQLFAFRTTRFWGSIKSPSSALNANLKYLELLTNENRLTTATNGEHNNCRPNVFIDELCVIDPSAEIGPNVSIGKRVKIGRGVRIRDAIILNDCIIQDDSCILRAVLGSRVHLKPWCRVEGAQCVNGHLKNLSGISYDENHNICDVTVIGHDCKVSSELMIRSSVVLPHKDISNNCHCEIVL